jgi:uncharacterized protein (TIGR02217 family)
VSNLLFQPPIGRNWPLKKTPTFGTQTLDTASGRGQLRSTERIWPIWNFELSFGYLRGNERLVNSEYQYLLGFYCAVQGAYNDFLYMDLLDNAIPVGAPEFFAFGDGVSTSFQLIRSIGVGSDIVQNLNGPATIYVNGVATGSVTIGATGIVTFASAPASGAVLTWTGNFYYRLHFKDDTLEQLELLMLYAQGYWELSSLKMESVILADAS